MKNYEKKYKEALCWIRKIYPTLNGCDKEDAERHFPELKESEDERIRKEIINYIKHSNVLVEQSVFISWISWLEKQGEEARNIALRTEYEKGRADAIAEIQKSDNKIIPIFRVGDVIKRKNGNGDTVIVSQVDTQHQCYCYGAWDGAATIYCDFNIDEQDEWELAEQKSAWSEKDEKMLKETLAFIETVEDINKVKDGFLDVKMWLKSLKDKRFPQSKQRQDEYITDEELIQARKDAYNDALDKIEYHSDTPSFIDGWSAAIWYLKKRNAIPSQKRWKPSDEQLDALRYIWQHYTPAVTERKAWESLKIIEILYGQLKKQKED